MRSSPRLVTAIRAIAVASLLAVVPLARADASETITATARVKSAEGVEATAPVQIVIDRFSTDAEREALMAALRQGGSDAARALLATRDRIGAVQIGKTDTAIQYAYARPMGSGRLITVITGSPIAFIGAGLPNAAPKAGFDLGLVVLEVTWTRAGRGELSPAAKVRLNDNGAIVTQDYAGEVVQLSNVVGK